MARRQLRVEWVESVDVCADCGAPICPGCDTETARCECCGEFNCERCGVYVVAGSERLH